MHYPKKDPLGFVGFGHVEILIIFRNKYNMTKELKDRKNNDDG